MRDLNSSNGVGTCAFVVEVGVLTTGPGEKSLWFYPHVPTAVEIILPLWVRSHAYLFFPHSCFNAAH